MTLTIDAASPLPRGARAANELFVSGPASLNVAGVRETIRGRMRATGTKLVVLDDDPTGSQSVQQVPVLTRWDADDVRWAFSQPADVFFVLTNTRSLDESETAALLGEVLTTLDVVASQLGQPYAVISRSDSTMRGHFPFETDVMAGFAADHGRPYDAVLIAPAYFAAGRVTTGDIHYARSGDAFLPVGSTDYAADATFGFRSSNLRDYVEEKTGGRIKADDVGSLTIEDIRLGGPSRVAEILVACRDQKPVIVNAVLEADLEVVVLGVLDAEDAGTTILYRTGPSFVPVRAGLVSRPLVTHEQIFGGRSNSGHGLVVVGSHVDLTGRQIERLLELPGVARVELDVPGVLDAARRDEILRDTGVTLTEALKGSDVVLVTSRNRVTGPTASSSLAIARQVSAALVALVKQVQAHSALSWVIAKGGITSSDVATAGLGMRRANVLGQLFPGVVSVWITEGLPYVVFAGNVGDDTSLAKAVDILRGDRDA
jgi:uncharacterized protein YgbK (DUF1537 family)